MTNRIWRGWRLAGSYAGVGGRTGSFWIYGMSRVNDVCDRQSPRAGFGRGPIPATADPARPPGIRPGPPRLGDPRSSSGTSVPAITRIVADEDTVRDVIHALTSEDSPRWAGGVPRRITDDDVAFILATARTRPTRLGLPFTTSASVNSPPTCKDATATASPPTPDHQSRLDRVEQLTT